MPISTHGPGADYSELWRRQAQQNNAKWSGLNQPAPAQPMHRIAPPRMSANARALLKQGASGPSNNAGSALSKIFNTYVLGRADKQQAEEAARNSSQRENRRGLWSWQLEQGLTLRQIASQSPSILADDKFLSFAASTKPAVAEEIEQFSVVQDPFGRGGVGQKSSTTGRISDWQAPAKGPETSADILEFEQLKAAGHIPNDMAYGDFKGLGKSSATTNVHVRGAAPTPESGYENIFDDSGNLLRQDLIEGSAAARQIAEAEAKAVAKAESAADRGTLVGEHAAGIRQSMEDAILPTTGLGGVATQHMPGTESHDISKRLDTLKALTGFEQLNQMRSQSPTGDALGQVSERELGFLQSVIGSLEQSQSEEQFRENLQRVEDAFSTVVHGPKAGQKNTGQGQPTGQANSARLRTIQGLNNKELLSQSARMATDDTYSREEKMAVHKLGVKRGLWSDF